MNVGLLPSVSIIGRKIVVLISLLKASSRYSLADSAFSGLGLGISSGKNCSWDCLILFLRAAIRLKMSLRPKFGLLKFHRSKILSLFGSKKG